MHLSFIHPFFLWLLVLLPLVWALALVGPRRIAAWRVWTSLALRTLILIGLVLALAGAQLVRPVGATTTIFVLDGSDSVALSQRARAEGFIQQALASMPTEDRAGLVVFGQQALVERPPSADTTLGQLATKPSSGATDIESALQLGLAMLPNEGHQRIVLLSDGGENLGSAQSGARLAAERGIPIDVIPLSGLADGLDAQISRVVLPASARAGQELRLQITLESNEAAQGRLIVEGPDAERILEQVVEVTTEPQTFDIILPEPQQAFNRYTARLEVANDARPENNAAEAYSFVSGQQRALLVEGEAGAAANLQAALAAARISADVRTPSAMPASIGALSAYDLVALVNVPKQAVPERVQSALAAYVHDLGRGLLMVGGTQAFGAGGWRDTPIEAALPVSMDIPTRFNIPPASIVVLIDTSGSMAEEEGGRTKLQLAADGAAQIAALMRDEDEITVIPFDSAPGRVVGPIRGSERDRAVAALQTIEPGGGGINIYDGLLAAERYVNQSTNPTRHVITITDGNDTQQQENALNIVQRLRDDQVTLTSVAVGDGSDVPFLRDAVQRGGGRFFLTQRASEVPSILADEAQAVIRPYIVETTFAPIQTAVHPILGNIESSPQLNGYVLTSAKDTAQVLLATSEGEPILATWQYGLGHAAAWTSDMSGAWARDWVTWEQFPRFGAQLTSWLLPTASSETLTLEPSTVNGALVLEARAQNSQNQLSGLVVEGQMLRGDGEVVEVALREVGPGQYRTAVNGAPPGAYLVQLVARDATGTIMGAVTAGAVVPQSAEYQARGANSGLLAALSQATGGSENISPTAAFAPNLQGRGVVSEIALPLLLLALLLLPFDVAVRRLGGLRTFQLPASKQPMPAFPTPPRPVESVPTQAITPAVKQPKQTANLERLREAQEQARKRARGEE